MALKFCFAGFAADTQTLACMMGGYSAQ